MSHTHTLLVGFDFGTNTSCLIASPQGSKEILVKKAIPTVVGYPKDWMIAGVLPEGQEVFFGHDALKNRAHLNLVYPMQDGVIADLPSAKLFVQHLRELLNPSNTYTLKAVIGMPANTTLQSQEAMREVAAEAFDQIILVPEPFLAALGFRNEKRLSDPTYLDPVRSSLFIDIGAGTSDLCIIQGYHPGQKDLISMPFAGDAIDRCVAESLHSQYPEVELSSIKARSIKESFSYVGPLKKGVVIKVLVNGKPRQLEVGPSIGQACNQLADKIFSAMIELIARCNPDFVESILQNIIMTGGGSRINGIAEELQTRLVREGYENPRVTTVGEHYKGFVAVGAWKAAHTTKADQWQHLLAKRSQSTTSVLVS